MLHITAREISCVFLTAGLFMLSACSLRQTIPAAGVYRFFDESVVSIRKSNGKILRYRFYENGKSGRLYPDGKNHYVSGDGFYHR